MTSIFLITTVLTSADRFSFSLLPHLLPSHIVGGFSPLLVLAVAISSLLTFSNLPADGEKTYCDYQRPSPFYFNCFVLVVQSFQQRYRAHALAPAGKEPPFAIAQLALLGGVRLYADNLCVKKFRAAIAARADRRFKMEN